jgi:DNA-binding NarL/FixJ family response regulator
MRGHPDFEFLLRRQAQLDASSRSVAATPLDSTRVLIAESNRMVAEALMLAIDVEPALEPIGYALDGWEAIELAETLSPDVVVVGPKLVGLDAFTLVGLLNEFWPSVQVIRLTTSGVSDRRARRSATERCISLDRSADELVEAIAAAARGAVAPARAEATYV